MIDAVFCLKPVRDKQTRDAFQSSRLTRNCAWWETVERNRSRNKLESSQSPHTSAKAMLFARWQHHLGFCSGFPYAPLKAMVTKISVIQNPGFFPDHPQNWITGSFWLFAIPDMPRKFQTDPSITFWVILLTHRQTRNGVNPDPTSHT